MKYKNVKVTGPLAKANWAKEMSIFKEGVLNRVGVEATAIMKESTTPHDFTGTLSNSITWRTAKNSGKIPNSRHKISAPPVDEVYIGSAAPHAWFREYGASEHRTMIGHAEFIRDIRLWFMDRWGRDPRAKETARIFKEIFWGIVRSIRYGPKAKAGVQNKQPFTPKSQAALPGLYQRAVRDGFTQMWNVLNKRYK